MPAAQVLRVVEGRELADCAVVALSMYLGVSYEDVLRAVAVLIPSRGKKGLHTGEIQKVAKALGTPLRQKRGKVEDDDYGILLTPDHALVLRNGLVFDPSGGVWELEDYLAAQRTKVETLLVAKD